MIRISSLASLIGCLALAAMVGAASAQSVTSQGVPNALQGFSQNQGQPIEIEAARLEVRDKQKIATFSGNVKVVQGDTTMRCKTLVVFYEGQDSPTPGAKANIPGISGGSQKISKLEAKGGVTVTQKDHTATGDTGLFEMRSNSVTLVGNVVVSQGANVVRGERLVVDLTTGFSRVDSGKGPVRMLIQPQQSGGGSGPGGILPGRPTN
jgi:lipopolysaccharide export system protein LptA